MYSSIESWVLGDGCPDQIEIPLGAIHVECTIEVGMSFDRHV